MPPKSSPSYWLQQATGSARAALKSPTPSSSPDRFNARMRGRNFTEADLPELMAYASRGIGYVTFNTLVFSNELQDAESFLR